MRALWSDRPNCSHNVSQKVKRIRRLSELWTIFHQIPPLRGPLQAQILVSMFLTIELSVPSSLRFQIEKCKSQKLQGPVGGGGFKWGGVPELDLSAPIFLFVLLGFFRFFWDFPLPPFGKKVKGSLLKSSFDKCERMDLPVFFPCSHPTPRPPTPLPVFPHFPQESHPPPLT